MFFTKALVLSLTALATAHPGHEEHERRQAIAARSAISANKRALQKCQSNLSKRGMYSAAAERRQTQVTRLRQTRGLPLTNSAYILPQPGHLMIKVENWSQ